MSEKIVSLGTKQQKNFNVQSVEGTRSAGMKVMIPNRDVDVLLISDSEVVDVVHHILDSTTDV